MVGSWHCSEKNLRTVNCKAVPPRVHCKQWAVNPGFSVITETKNRRLGPGQRSAAADDNETLDMNPGVFSPGPAECALPRLQLPLPNSDVWFRREWNLTWKARPLARVRSRATHVPPLLWDAANWRLQLDVGCPWLRWAGTCQEPEIFALSVPWELKRETCRCCSGSRVALESALARTWPSL